MYAKIATNIPAAVATSASLITGAIVEKPTLLTVENLAKDSKIPTTVPNKPIKGEVEDIIERAEIPELASLTKEILQTFKTSLETAASPMHLPIEDKGFIILSLETKELRLFFSKSTLLFNWKNLYKNTQKVNMKYKESTINTVNDIAVLPFI